MNFDVVIVGAGFSGIVLAQKFAQDGKKVCILEKRNHIGGNCYDYEDENGILIHQYGPHIFHTNYKDVWQYVNRFSEFSVYQHKVLGFIDGNLAPIPFNLDSLYTLISQSFAQQIEASLLKNYSYNSRVSINELRKKAQETGDENLSFIANYIFEKVFKNYTMKQWGISAEEIKPEILDRVPILISKDGRYFQDIYQGMPEKGYTKMMEKMLQSEDIQVKLGTDYKDVLSDMKYKKLIFTGPIDEYFGYKYGKLDYKKTAYILKTHEVENYQSVTTVNYPNDYDFTRISEFKKLYPHSPANKKPVTVTCSELPGVGDIEAYPVLTDENDAILKQYQADAEKLENVYFVGRLANYKYFNMDQTIKNALDFYTNNFGE